MRSTDRLGTIPESLLQHRTPYLAPEVLRETVLRAQAGDKKAEDLVVRTSARMIFKYVNKALQGQVERDDLFQAGVMGLMRAIQTFNPAIGAQFYTHAVFWIRAHIHRARSRASTVREPYRSLPEAFFESIDHFEFGDDDATEMRTKDLVDPGENPEQIATRRELSRLVRLQASDLKYTGREKDILFGRVLNRQTKHSGKNSLRDLGKKHKVSRECIRITEQKVEQRLKVRLKRLAEEVR